MADRLLSLFDIKRVFGQRPDDVPQTNEPISTTTTTMAPASVAKMPSPEERESSSSPQQLFYAVKQSANLFKPAIFLSWNDCEPFVQSEEDFKCFFSLADAGKYISSNDGGVRMLADAALDHDSVDERKRPAKRKSAGNKDAEQSGGSQKRQATSKKNSFSTSKGAADDSTGSKQAVTIQKKRRGRPRKVTVDDKATQPEIEEANMPDPQEAVLAAQPSEPEEQKEASTEQHTTPKKKRGRPKKVVPEKTSLPIPQEQTSPELSPPPKSKRGRPKKVVATNEAGQQGTEGETTRPSGEEGTEKENVTPKKKRSRPGKETVEATDQNNTAPAKDSTDAAMEVVEGASQDEAASTEKKTPKTTPRRTGRYQQNLDLKWNKRLEELKAYKEIHGHTNVPKSYTENELLARWVENQRSCYEKFSKGRHTSMTVERFQALATAGFDFTIPRGRKPEDKKLHNKQWKLRFEELKQFREIHGHCNVPHKPPCQEFPQLARFVSSQRTHYRKHREGKTTSLTAERIGLLNSIGFTWQLNEQWVPWEERYAQLVEYKERYAQLVEYKERFGHCKVPVAWKKGQGIPNGLGWWVSRQRKMYKQQTSGEKVGPELSQERIDQLNAIGFTWQLRKRGKSTGTVESAEPPELEEAMVEPLFY